MALIKCKECKHEVSSTAKTCPNCGAKVKTGGGCLSVIGIFGAAFLFLIMVGTCSDSGSRRHRDSSSSSSSSSEPVSNSPWDGSVYQVEQYLKSNLKDPDSYESVEWSKVAKTADGGYMVRHKYRAKNSFGGYVIEEKVFTLDSRGRVLQSVP